MEPLRVAVIGVGHLGIHHARIYSRLPGARLVGVCDIDPARARAVARQCRTQAYTHHETLLSQNQLDAVSVVVPTQSHHSIAKACLERGLHVLVEKPMTTTLAEAEELLALARKRQLTLQVGHIERFNAAYRQITTFANAPRFIECHRLGPFTQRSTDIGVVLDLMIHDIDIVLGLIRSPVASVDAVGIPVLTPFEDIANVRVRFQNNAVVNLTASRLSTKTMRKIRIFQENLYVSLDYLTQTADIYRKSAHRITVEKLRMKKEEPLKNELTAFLHAVRTRTAPLVSGEDGYQALRLAFTIQEKIQEHLAQ